MKADGVNNIITIEGVVNDVPKKLTIIYYYRDDLDSDKKNMKMEDFFSKLIDKISQQGPSDIFYSYVECKLDFMAYPIWQQETASIAILNDLKIRNVNPKTRFHSIDVDIDMNLYYINHAHYTTKAFSVLNEYSPGVLNLMAVSLNDLRKESILGLEEALNPTQEFEFTGARENLLVSPLHLEEILIDDDLRNQIKDKYFHQVSKLGRLEHPGLMDAVLRAEYLDFKDVIQHQRNIRKLHFDRDFFVDANPDEYGNHDESQKANRALVENEIGVYYELQNQCDTFKSLYFLKRFLDKTYIKNACLYIDYYQALYILYILVNKMKFKISYVLKVPEGSSVAKMEWHIKELNNYGAPDMRIPPIVEYDISKFFA